MSTRAPLKRARKEGSVVRGDRAAQDRTVTEDRTLTDSERVDLLRRSFFQSSLPDLPKIPGYHTCWLTTQNPRDPVHGRLRLGYEILQASELPGWEHLGNKTGDYVGAVGVNEMIAAKLPLHLYEAYMREVHHDAPLREEDAIYNNAVSAGEEAAQAAKRGGRMKGPMIESGTEELGKAREAPSFASDEEG
jgi:hypothetical protein